MSDVEIDEETVHVPMLCRLDEDELRRHAERLAQLMASRVLVRLRIDQATRTIEEFGARLADHEQEIGLLQQQLDRGWQMRPIDCVRRVDPVDGTLRTYRLDTQQEIERLRLPAVDRPPAEPADRTPAGPVVDVEEMPPVPGFIRVSVPAAEWHARTELALYRVFPGHHWRLEGTVYRARSWEGAQLQGLLDQARRSGLAPRVEQAREQPSDSLIDNPLDDRPSLIEQTTGRVVDVVLDAQDVRLASLRLLASVAPGIPWRVHGHDLVADIRSSEGPAAMRMLESCRVRLHGVEG